MWGAFSRFSLAPEGLNEKCHRTIQWHFYKFYFISKHLTFWPVPNKSHPIDQMLQDWHRYSA